MPGSNVYISSGGAVGAGGSPAASTTAAGAGGGASAGIPAIAYLGAGLGLLQAFNTFTQNSQIADTQGYEDLYTEFGNQEYTGDFNNIIQQRRGAYLGKVPSWKKIRLMNNGAKVGSAVTSAGSGAMAGAGFGPWGMGIGALVGLGASLLGSQAGDAKAKEEEGRLTMLREKALADNQKNFLSGVKNAEQQVNFNALSNIAAFGGPLHTHGADWTNGITVADNGGTDEQNPFEGVPMGIAPDGQPNLAEEGAVIFNDYVFSNRLRVPKAVREKYKLRGQKEMTFADAAKKAQKESEERPNDPISQRGLEDIMYKLMTEQEAIRESRQQKKYSEGGRIYIAPSKKGTFTAAASKHGMGVQEFASKVLANPEDYSPAMRKKANFARNASKWKHAYGGHLFKDGGWGNNLFNIPEITTTGIPPRITPYISLLDPSSEVKARAEAEAKAKAMTNINSLQTESPYTALGLPKFTMGQGLLQPPKLKIPAVKTPTRIEGTIYQKPKTSPLANLRYLPAVGAGIGALTDAFGITNRPDYTNADNIMEAARQGIGSMRDVAFTPVGNYLTYRPFDTLFYGNQLASQAGATRRAIRNNANGNRMTAIAGLLAADYNAQAQLGNLFRQAEEYNLAQKERVGNFNRATNEFNSEGLLKAAMANTENAQQKAKIRLTAAEKAAAIRDAVDSRVGAARSANLTNLFNSLGDIGREAYTMDMIMNNPSLLYDWLGRYKGKLLDDATGKSTSKAKGGYLTIKRRR